MKEYDTAEDVQDIKSKKDNRLRIKQEAKQLRLNCSESANLIESGERNPFELIYL